jgi:hypothetical protein
MTALLTGASRRYGYKAIDFYKNNMTSGKVLFVP